VPDEAAHRAAYTRHHAAYSDTVNAYPDWAAIMLFYCAVHLVEQFFAFESKHFCEHSEREFEIKANYHSIWADYRALKSESLKARYMDGGLFNMTAAQVQKKLAPRLDRIKTDIDGRIAARRIPGL
jgi:hypothetical protein